MARVLFVTSVAFGGALESSRLLCDAIAERGHEVDLVHARRERGRWAGLHQRAVNLSTKAARRGVGEPLWWLTERVAPLASPAGTDDGVAIVTAAIPENAAMARVADTDVVVGFSIARPAWRRVLRRCRRAGVPTVLYLREDEALGHLQWSDPADRVVANAEIHAIRGRALGHDVEVIPSIIDRDRARTTSTRRVALLVNPVPAYGVDLVVEVARACPEIPVVLQESWPLDASAERELRAVCRRLPNLELRRFTADIASIYRDARVLLVPYRDDNRPRVVAEAQANGIPILGADRPGIAEVTGPGGRLVDPDAPLSDWVAQLRDLWADDESYGGLSEAASANSRAAEEADRSLVDRFAARLMELVGPADGEGPAPGRTDMTLPLPDSPRLSVVIPARDAAATIDEQLAALERQSFDGDVEVIVVDNGSNDDTAERARSHRLPLKVVAAADGTGVAYARNVGIAAARSDKIVVCDADDVVVDGWLHAMDAALDEHGIVGGPTEVNRLNSSALARSRGRNDMGSALRRGVVPMLPGCNFGIRREVFDAVGSFDEDFDGLEDHEFALRAAAGGHQIGFVPDAVVHYRFRTSAAELWRQGVFYGRSHPILARRAADLGLGTPRRFEWKGWVWLVVYLPLLFLGEHRLRWLWVAANRWGRLRGSVEARSVYL